MIPIEDRTAFYPEPGTYESPTMAELRAYIARNPWQPGKYGKGYITPLGRVLAWSTKPMYGASDGWPAHVDGLHALGYDMDRAARATFRINPNGIVSPTLDVDDYDTELFEQVLTLPGAMALNWDDDDEWDDDTSDDTTW